MHRVRSSILQSIPRYATLERSECTVSPVRPPPLRLGDAMNRIIDSLLGNRQVVVWTDDGVMQGKKYCREREVSGYVRDLMRISNGTLNVVITKE